MFGLVPHFYLLAQRRHSHLNQSDWLHIAIATNNERLLARFNRF